MAQDPLGALLANALWVPIDFNDFILVSFIFNIVDLMLTWYVPEFVEMLLLTGYKVYVFNNDSQ